MTGQQILGVALLAIVFLAIYYGVVKSTNSLVSTVVVWVVAMTWVLAVMLGAGLITQVIKLW